jgi:hypothetical protein
LSTAGSSGEQVLQGPLVQRVRPAGQVQPGLSSRGALSSLSPELQVARQRAALDQDNGHLR